MSARRKTLLGMDPATGGATLLLAAVSGFLNYIGLGAAADSFGGSWLTPIGTAALSLAVSVVIFAFWKNAYLAVAELRRGQPILSSMGVTTGVIPLILAISSWFNVAGLAGEAAVRLDMALGAEKIAEDVDARLGGSALARRFQSEIAQAASRYEADATAECTEGSRTGSGGEGTICFTLRDAASQLGGLANVALPDLVARGAAASAEAQVFLAEMRKVIDEEADLAEAYAEAARLTGALRAALGKAGGGEAAAAIRGVLAGLPAVVDKYPLSARSQAGRASQQEALGRIRSELEGLSKRMLADLEAAEPKARAPLKGLERVNAAEAVWIHAGRFAPFWAAGVALDLMPLPILLFMLIQRLSLTEKELKMREVMARSIHDHLMDAAGQELLRSPTVIDQNTVRGTIDSAFGLLPERQAPAAAPEDEEDRR